MPRPLNRKTVKENDIAIARQVYPDESEIVAVERIRPRFTGQLKKTIYSDAILMLIEHRTGKWEIDTRHPTSAFILGDDANYVLGDYNDAAKEYEKFCDFARQHPQ